MDFFYPFEVMGEVGRYAPMGYTVVWVPTAFAATLPAPPKSRPRIIGVLGGFSFTGALHPTSDGRAYFIFNKQLQKKTGLGEGDPISIAFRFDDPDAVDLPPELAQALSDDEGAGEVWAGLTPGTQRGFAHQVSSAKTDATRRKRVLAVLAALEEPNPSPHPKRR